ncbi:hypothetical protein OFB99_27125, partial [Escherichia coli]|nr:hypothetical protein [Escherichia coli]
KRVGFVLLLDGVSRYLQENMRVFKNDGKKKKNARQGVCVSIYVSIWSRFHKAYLVPCYV